VAKRHDLAGVSLQYLGDDCRVFIIEPGQSIGPSADDLTADAEFLGKGIICLASSRLLGSLVKLDRRFHFQVSRVTT
jgi:hypothetical protein